MRTMLCPKLCPKTRSVVSSESLLSVLLHLLLHVTWDLRQAEAQQKSDSSKVDALCFCSKSTVQRRLLVQAMSLQNGARSEIGGRAALTRIKCLRRRRS